jgi:hypothetical protein
LYLHERILKKAVEHKSTSNRSSTRHIPCAVNPIVHISIHQQLHLNPSSIKNSFPNLNPYHSIKMSRSLFRLTRLAAASRPSVSAYTPFRMMSATTIRGAGAVVDSHFISQITAAEKTITKQNNPVQGGPTAQAQSHVGQPLTAQIVHDITMGERSITGRDGPVQNGPTAIAQQFLTQDGAGPSSRGTANAGANSSPASGMLDSETIAKITEREKMLTGSDEPVKGGPTAQAQKHAGEPITSEALHDITEGEKKVTGGERVKGGPTSKAQSELGKSRS